MISKKDNLVILSLLIFIDILFFIIVMYFSSSEIVSMRYLILSILYLYVCYESWLIIKNKINGNRIVSENKYELDIERTSSLDKTNKQEQSLSMCYIHHQKNIFDIIKESLIIIIGNFVAFSFAIFYSSSYDGNVVSFISEAVRIEVLLLAIGVPLVFNTILNRVEHDHDKNPEAVQLLRKYIQLSLLIILLLLYQLVIFNKDVSGFHQYIGFLEINDITTISISLFLFIISLFFFCYILFNLINIYLLRRISDKSIESLRKAIRIDDKEYMKKHLGMFNDTCIIEIINDMIRYESNNASESWINGIFFVLHKYHKIYKKSKSDDVRKNAMQLLYGINNKVRNENQEEIRNFIEENYPNIKKVTI